MEDKINKKFSIIQIAKSFNNAGRGLYIFVKSTHNSWVEFFVFILVLITGIYFNINKIEWISIIIVSGIVFISEAFNTSIEIDMDLTSPEFHPYARDTKDVAAGAVLLSSILAIVVGLIIFVPYIMASF